MSTALGSGLGSPRGSEYVLIMCHSSVLGVCSAFPTRLHLQTLPLRCEAGGSVELGGRHLSSQHKEPCPSHPPSFPPQVCLPCWDSGLSPQNLPCLSCPAPFGPAWAWAPWWTSSATALTWPLLGSYHGLGVAGSSQCHSCLHTSATLSPS